MAAAAAVVLVVMVGNGDGNGGSSGDGKGTVVSKIPSRPQGVHLPPNPNTPNNLSQANPTGGGDVT